MASNVRDPAGDALISAISAFGKMLKSMFYGIRSLNSVPKWLGLAAALSVTAVGFFHREKILTLEVHPIGRGMMLFGLLMIPVLYLVILGQTSAAAKDKYSQIFKEIGFIGRDKKPPSLVSIREDGKKTIYIFSSNIPLSAWQKAADALETGLDCSIRRIQEGKNKKMVELITVASNYKIPERIDWKDSRIIDRDGVLVVGESDLDVIEFDLNKTPHVLAAGETGSGKSVTLRTMLWQMANKGCRLFMVDFKGGVEFGKQYEQFGEVITERERALEVFQSLVAENEKRLKLFRELEVKNLKEYNKKTGSNLCRIGVFIDEIAEMLDKKGASKDQKNMCEKLEGALSTLARLSRATGINLFLGVQRPDANVLTGQIKNNIPVRISGRFADKSASEIVLGNTDACNLPATKGRFLFKLGNETIEFQAFYFDDDTMLHPIDIEQGSMLTEDSAKSDKPAEQGDNRPTAAYFTKNEDGELEPLGDEDSFDFDFDDDFGDEDDSDEYNDAEYEDSVF